MGNTPGASGETKAQALEYPKKYFGSGYRVRVQQYVARRKLRSTIIVIIGIGAYVYRYSMVVWFVHFAFTPPSPAPVSTGEPNQKGGCSCGTPCVPRQSP